MTGVSALRAGRRRLSRLLAAGAAVIMVWLGAGLGLRAAYFGEVMPGTRMGGVSLGGASPAAARQALASAFSAPRTVTLGYRDRRFALRPREAGYRVDLDASVARARRAGRDGMRGLWSAVPSLWAPRTLDPVFELDRRRLDSVIASIARRIDRTPFPGDLAIDGRPPGVRAVPPRPGRALDRAEAAAAALAALHVRERAVVQLPVRTRPAVRREQVEAVARRARGYLRTLLALAGTGEPLTLSRRQTAQILGVEQASGSGDPRVRLGVDPGRAQRLVAALATKLERDARDARITVPPRPVVLEDQGDVTWTPRRAAVQVTPGRSGRRLERSAAAEALASAVRRGRHTARLVLRPVPARLTTRSARRVSSVLGTFTTRFACCEPRVTNIQLIAKAVDNTVVLPGERFSLNRVAGPRTSSKGYLPAPFIADGKVVPAVGGGVSQFSTTIYNAAYFAGLRIDRRQPHSFYIDRYPPGREATLDYASIDLIWTNDTGAPVLVRATADATTVTVTLYGAPRARRVEARTGPRLPRPRGGFTITVTRAITLAGRRVLRQPFTTSYDEPPAEP